MSRGAPHASRAILASLSFVLDPHAASASGGVICEPPIDADDDADAETTALSAAAVDAGLAAAESLRAPVRATVMALVEGGGLAPEQVGRLRGVAAVY